MKSTVDQNSNLSMQHFEISHNKGLEIKVPSVIDPSIIINPGFWAISLITQDMSKDWVGDPEHALLIMQGCNEHTLPVYRIELISRYSKGRVDVSYIPEDHAKEKRAHSDDLNAVQDMVDILLWRNKKEREQHLSEFPKERLAKFRDKTKTMIQHKTWLIPDEKAQSLLASIKSDFGKKINYEITGDRSFITRRNLGVSLASIPSLGYAGIYGFIKILDIKAIGYALPNLVYKFMYHSIASSPKFIYRSFLSVSGIALGASTPIAPVVVLAPLLIAAAIACTIPKVMPSTPSHNCFTWLRKHLRALGIEEINTALPITPMDAIATTTSSHIAQPDKQNSIPEVIYIKLAKVFMNTYLTKIAPVIKKTAEAKQNNIEPSYLPLE